MLLINYPSIVRKWKTMSNALRSPRAHSRGANYFTHKQVSYKTLPIFKKIKHAIIRKRLKAPFVSILRQAQEDRASELARRSF